MLSDWEVQSPLHSYYWIATNLIINLLNIHQLEVVIHLNIEWGTELFTTTVQIYFQLPYIKCSLIEKTATNWHGSIFQIGGILS